MRMVKASGILMIFVPVLVLAGCGKDDAPMSHAEQESEASNAEGGRTADTPALPGMPGENRQTQTELNASNPAEALSAAIIKDLLPVELPGMRRTGASAEQTRTMTTNLTVATAEYVATGGGPARISIALTDGGNMSGPMRMGLAAWAAMSYSRQTATGYERTITYDGYGAMEEYDREGRHGAVRVFVAERFIVEVEGNDITEDALKQALANIDLKRLAVLASGS